VWDRLRRFLLGVNPLVAACTLLLLGTGWMLVASATVPPGQEGLWPLPALAIRQAVWIALGLLALLAGMTLDYHVLLRLAPWVYGAGIALLLLVLGAGHTSYGARRWFDFRGVFVQPAEFAKIGLLLLLARQIAASPERPDPLGRLRIPRWLPRSAAVVALPMLLILAQPNLGTAVLLLSSALAVWVVAGLSWTIFAAAGGAVAAVAPVAWSILKDYQRARVLNFLNPYRDPLGGGYTVIQSVTAIGSGGLTGRGFLAGPQNRLDYVPKHHTDFIVSVLGEEFGWLGCAAVLFAYLLLYLEGLRIAHRARDFSGTLLAAGLVGLLGFQTLVNLGMNVGIVPVTGLPLPLLSYGGSSLLVSCWLLGLLLNIGTQRRR
jgi:rod shape determining protein RodA